MRRLCFGGSFNPIHHGHLICARFLAETARFDRVVLIPCAQPPHKPEAFDLADPAHRLAMCRLAVAAEPALFEVEDIELRRAGPSFTIDTVRQLKQRGWADLSWLIGADMLAGLATWHRCQELIAEVNFVVIPRPPWQFDWPALPAEYRHLQRNVLPAPLVDISATDIRRRLAAGLSIAYLTPPAVIEYIQTHGLYRAERASSPAGLDV
jgi:nicotinate-nucleotide adenylyltransferase